VVAVGDMRERDSRKKETKDNIGW